MYYSALICSRRETCRSGEAYLAKDLQSRNSDLPGAAVRGRVMHFSDCIHSASLAARHSFSERPNSLMVFRHNTGNSYIFLTID